MNLVSFSSFLNTRNTLRELLQVMLNLCHVFGNIETAKRDQKGVDMLLQTLLGFGRCFPEGEANSRRGAAFLSNSSQQRAEFRRIHDQLDSAKATRNQLRHQLYIARDTLKSKGEEFSALALIIQLS